MRETTCEAVVLHRRDYRETSLLVELFAPGLGRCAAIARGARRPRNPAAALLQPFQPLWLGIAGRGEVRTLSRCEAAGPPIALAGPALACGFYLNELLLRLLARHDPHDALFVFHQATLARLAATPEDPHGALRQFELRLLAELGYGLTLDRVAETGEAVRADDWYRFAPGVGGVSRIASSGWVRDARDDEDDGGEPLLSGATLLALARDLPLDPLRRREARDLLRRALAPHLGGRPLHSRALLRYPAPAILGVNRDPEPR